MPQESKRVLHRQRQARYEARLRAGVALYPAPLGAGEIDALVALRQQDIREQRELAAREAKKAHAELARRRAALPPGEDLLEQREGHGGSPHPKEHIDCGNDTDRDAGRPKHVFDHGPG
jgi:hypothetical protein